MTTTFQGDSLAGFRKDHEHFLFFTITDRAAAKAPGPRGRLSGMRQDFLTPRLIDPSDARALRFLRGPRGSGGD